MFDAVVRSGRWHAGLADQELAKRGPRWHLLAAVGGKEDSIRSYVEDGFSAGCRLRDLISAGRVVAKRSQLELVRVNASIREPIGPRGQQQLSKLAGVWRAAN